MGIQLLKFAPMGATPQAPRPTGFVCKKILRRLGGLLNGGRFLLHRQHFVEGAHVGPGAGNNNIGAGSVSAKGAGRLFAGLRIGRKVVGNFRLYPNGHFANGVNAFGDGLHNEFGQDVWFAYNAIDGLVHGVNRTGADGRVNQFDAVGVGQADGGGGVHPVAAGHMDAV